MCCDACSVSFITTLPLKVQNITTPIRTLHYRIIVASHQIKQDDLEEKWKEANANAAVNQVGED